MRTSVSVAFVVLGVGVFVFGLSGYHGGGEVGRAGFYRIAGWDPEYQLAMAVGAMLMVAGWLARPRA
jgi:hypothetical protein